jgi:uncharacterized membrane protein YidH (DUF202 family)
MKKTLIALGSFGLPLVALAQNPGQLFGILGIVKDVLNFVIPIVITLGVIYVIWGVIQFVTKTNEEERASAKNAIIYGIIGLFVVVSVWGLVGFVQNTLGIGGGGSAPIPCVDVDPYTPGCQ